MSRAMATLAARVIGRRVRVSCPCGRASEGTITRVTSEGFTIATTGHTATDVTLLD